MTDRRALSDLLIEVADGVLGAAWPPGVARHSDGTDAARRGRDGTHGGGA